MDGARPEALEGGELGFEALGVARGEFDGFGEEEALGGDVALLHALEHFFEKNAFVRGVLVEQDHAAIGFHDHVKAADDAEDSQRDVQKGDGICIWGRRRGRRRSLRLRKRMLRPVFDGACRISRRQRKRALLNAGRDFFYDALKFEIACGSVFRRQPVRATERAGTCGSSAA